MAHWDRSYTTSNDPYYEGRSNFITQLKSQGHIISITF